MKSKFYINLGIIFITVYIDERFYTIAFNQILNSRYGQSLFTSENNILGALYYMKWNIEYDDQFWSINVNEEKTYFINNLELLGIHYQNHSDEISNYLENMLFKSFVGYHANLISNSNGEVIMICGKMGTGKTTLTKSLIEIGYNYVSDDFALIDKEMNCFYFRTSLHMRVSKLENKAHKLNNEYRKFEKINVSSINPSTLKLKGVVILEHFTNKENTVIKILDIYQKFKYANAFLIGFPDSNYVFSFFKVMLKLPFYKIILSNNLSIITIGELIEDLKI